LEKNSSNSSNPPLPIWSSPPNRRPRKARNVVRVANGGCQALDLLDTVLGFIQPLLRRSSHDHAVFSAPWRSGRHSPQSVSGRLAGPARALQSDPPWPRHGSRAFKGTMIDADKDMRLAFFQGDRRRRIGAPHHVGLLGDNRTVVGFGAVRMPHARRRRQAVLAHQGSAPALSRCGARQSATSPTPCGSLPHERAIPPAPGGDARPTPGPSTGPSAPAF